MTKKNRQYTIEEKEMLINRILPPENCSARSLANETGISQSTLATWKSKALKGATSKNVGRPKDAISSREKFMVVMETYTLSEIELSKYCRKNGIYVEDVKKWRQSCLEANENGARLIPACETVGISKRTYERWYRGGKILEDRRKDAIRPEPSNKL
ncbi:transposase [Terrisporobacter petrolearius]|uniref:transposase n=1 Tax=Terrisporobacter petrolearius TaxID=1460447 RepID=UPI0022E6E780|nr:transposase [Terrisporobacter petrolearius]